MICKTFAEETDTKTLSAEDLALINQFTQKQLTSDEIFTFSVILCDNDVDRDFERFTVSALQTLSELFVGKTAIRNHSMRSEDQSARTYKTKVFTDSTRKNTLGEPYTFLKAWCYMPKIEKNKDLIAEIKAGILKEVSVGCAVSKTSCSICGKNHKEGCSHQKGKTYGNKLCYYELDAPTDAYEWSFVAVPAQKNAGVTKAYKGSVEVTEALTKQIATLEAENETLKTLAEAGKRYRVEKENKFVKLFIKAYPTLESSFCNHLSKILSIEDLEILVHTFEEKSIAVHSPQLVGKDGAQSSQDLSSFKF